MAAVAALGLVLLAQTAASNAAATAAISDNAAAPPPPNIAYAILKTIVARKIGALGDMVLAANDAQNAETVIRIANFTFDPPTLTVHVGSSVTWKNEDDIVHVIREKDAAFSSDALDTDGTFSHTFNQVGIVDYFCAIHPHMTGRIVVEP
jgi:plastocyanin